jgi:hypothetical protein
MQSVQQMRPLALPSKLKSVMSHSEPINLAKLAKDELSFAVLGTSVGIAS